MPDLKTKLRVAARLRRRRKQRRARAARGGPNPLRIDPTRTATLRRRFEADLARRFARLRLKIHQLLVVEDALGLRAAPGTVEALMAPPEPAPLVVANNLLRNQFCPTGPGGGVDPTCSPSGGRSGGGADGSLGGVVSTLKRLAAVPGHVEHAVAAWVRDGLRAAVARLPEAVQDAVKLAYLHAQTATKAAFAVWTAGQALAERVAREKGATEKEAKALRGVLGRIDLVTFEAAKVAAVSGLHAAHLPAAVTATLPIASTTYLLYSGATAPLATLRAAREAVKDAAGEAAEALDVGRPRRGVRRAEARLGVEQLDTRNQLLTGNSDRALRNARRVERALRAHQYRDWYQALLYAAMDETPDVARAIRLADRAFERQRHDPSTPAPDDSLAVFGHRLLARRGTLNSVLIGNTRWRFQSRPEQVRAFRDWLRANVHAELLGPDDDALWRSYVEEGFRRGAGRAFDDVNTARKRTRWGPKEGDFYRGTRQQFLRDSFAQPVAVEKVKLLAGRTLDDLEGITQQMSTALVRDLTNGLVMGQNPEDIAAQMAADVDGIGLQRAKMIARTEIVRAHAEGQLQALEDMGVEEVGVAVEWSTAGDDKVCAACAPMEGVVLKLEEAHNLIPRHPNCRCSFVPANVGEDDAGQKRSGKEVRRALRDSAAEGDDAAGAGDGEEGDDWGGLDVDVSTARPRSTIFNRLAALNAFCPTGEGGGIDNSCPPFRAGGAADRAYEAAKAAALPKGVWKKVAPGTPEFEHYRSQLYRLIQNAYKDIGGHIKIKDEASLDRYQYWLVNDMDDDPEIDVVIFGKGEFGVKSAGVGHDGSEAAVKMYKNEAARLKRGEDPESPHWWGEASGKAAYALMSRDVPAVEDKAKVAKLLGKDKWKWLGDHPDPEAPELFKKYHGWYEKDFGGGHKHVKIILGLPDLGEPPPAANAGWTPVQNAFCPTGEGGGIDNSCPPSGGGRGVREAPPGNVVEARDRFNAVSQRLFGKHGEDAGIFTVRLDGGRTITAHLKVPMEIKGDQVVSHYRVRVDFGVEGRAAASVSRELEKESLAVARKVKEAVAAYHRAGFEIEVDPADSRRREWYARVLRKMGLRHEGGDYTEVWNRGGWEPLANAFCPTGEGGGIDNSCPPSGKRGGSTATLDEPATHPRLSGLEPTDNPLEYRSPRRGGAVRFKDESTRRAAYKFLETHFHESVTVDDLADLSGAPEGADVLIDYGGRPSDPHIVLMVHHDGIDSMSRSVRVDPDEGPYMKNEAIEVKAHGGGLGRKVFEREVEACRRLGVRYIECHAAGDYDDNLRGEFSGYAVWPQLGYDQGVDDLTTDVRDRVKAAFGNDPETVLDIIERPDVTVPAGEAADMRKKLDALDRRLGRPPRDWSARKTFTGREWWTVHGGDLFNARFDTADGSRSMRILQGTRARKGGG